MPLEKSSSDAAFRENVREMVNAGHPQQQALAAAYRIKRQRRADGGRVHVGALDGATGGRADHVPIEVPPGAYVLPADHVSSLGEGNTANGLAILEEMFGDGGEPMQPSDAKGVPIYAADGEYVISPEKVAEIGGGDINAGHKILDEWVVENRKNHIKTLSKLPGPAKK